MPPFKSEAQRRKILQLEKEGKLKKGTAAAWEEETKGALPERVKGSPKKGPRTIQEIREIAVKRFGKK